MKDDGRTGRRFSTVNTDKVRTEHREYRSALMVFRNDRGQWFNVAYRADLRMHQPGSQFTIDDLVWTQQCRLVTAKPGGVESTPFSLHAT